MPDSSAAPHIHRFTYFSLPTPKRARSVCKASGRSTHNGLSHFVVINHAEAPPSWIGRLRIPRSKLITSHRSPVLLDQTLFPPLRCGACGASRVHDIQPGSFTNLIKELWSQSSRIAGKHTGGAVKSSTPSVRE